MSNEEDQAFALKLCREVNGLRCKLSTPTRLAEDDDYNLEIAIERKDPITRKAAKQPPPDDFYEIEEYKAYDPITHHVLLNYKGTYRTLQEKYEWQPVLVLLLDYYAQGKFDLVKELETAVCTLKAEYIKDPSEYIAKQSKAIWNLDRKPITDFDCQFSKVEPFVGFIPSEYQPVDSIYKGHNMVVYSLRKKDGRNVFGLTDFASLEKALEKSKKVSLLKELRGSVKQKEKIFLERTQEIIFGDKCALDNLEEILNMMGGEIRLSEPKENFSVQADQMLQYLYSLERKKESHQPQKDKEEFQEACQTLLQLKKRSNIVSEEDYKRFGPKKARFWSEG